MLTRFQSEKVAVALTLISEVEHEVKETDSSKAVLLNNASKACDEVLQQDLPKGYLKPTYIRETVKYKPTTGDYILGVLGWIVGISFITSALCACLSLGAFGISEFKAASGWKDSNNYAGECRGYRGLSFTFLAIALSGGVLASVVGNATDGGNE